jgi:hypothetical protein
MCLLCPSIRYKEDSRESAIPPWALSLRGFPWSDYLSSEEEKKRIVSICDAFVRWMHFP